MAKSVENLIAEYARLVKSRDNGEKRASLWRRITHNGGRFHVHGHIPAPNAESGVVPVITDVVHSFWARILGFNMTDYYRDPETFVRAEMESLLLRRETFDCDFLYEPALMTCYETVLEASIFGVKVVWSDTVEPSIGKGPAVSRVQDIESIQPPDFHLSGLMPQLHALYKGAKRIVGGKLEVEFPGWWSNVIRVGGAMRGMADLLADMIAEPEFVKRLFRYITDAEKNWVLERARFVGETIGARAASNDEVSVPSVSPKQYEEYILPLEKELSFFYGGYAYWHSCGDISPLAPLIRQLPRIDMLHVSPWNSDLRKVLTLFKDTPMQICMHPIDDILRADEARMRARIREVVSLCREVGVRAYYISSGALAGHGTVEEDIRRLKTWIRVAREETQRPV